MKLGHSQNEIVLILNTKAAAEAGFLAVASAVVLVARGGVPITKRLPTKTMTVKKANIVVVVAMSLAMIRIERNCENECTE